MELDLIMGQKISTAWTHFKKTCSQRFCPCCSSDLIVRFYLLIHLDGTDGVKTVVIEHGTNETVEEEPSQKYNLIYCTYFAIATKKKLNEENGNEQLDFYCIREISKPDIRGIYGSYLEYVKDCFDEIILGCNLR